MTISQRASHDLGEQATISIDGVPFVRDGDTLIPVYQAKRRPPAATAPKPTPAAKPEISAEGGWLELPLHSIFSPSER